jgi:hypothetical protein
VCNASKIEKKRIPKKPQRDNIENVEGPVVYLKLFIDGNGKCKLPSMPSSPGFYRCQHLIEVMVKF